MNSDLRFWQFFGTVWLLVGVGWWGGSLITILLVVQEDQTRAVLAWMFCAIGVAISIAGGTIAWRARRAAARRRPVES